MHTIVSQCYTQLLRLYCHQICDYTYFLSTCCLRHVYMHLTFTELWYVLVCHSPLSSYVHYCYSTLIFFDSVWYCIARNFARRNFTASSDCWNFCPVLLIAYIEDTESFTMLAKVCSTEHFCTPKVKCLSSEHIQLYGIKWGRMTREIFRHQCISEEWKFVLHEDVAPPTSGHHRSDAAC